jgi:hypothetical protein
LKLFEGVSPSSSNLAKRAYKKRKKARKGGLKLLLKSYHSKCHSGQENIRKHSLVHNRISKKHNLDLGNCPMINEQRFTNRFDDPL